MTIYEIRNNKIGELIQGNWKACNYIKSPNTEGKLDQKYLVIHYTGGNKASQAINWFQLKGSNASAHIIIDINGEITQMVPFNTAAQHAGVSRWDGLSSLNKYTIGVELVNGGRLQKCEQGWEAIDTLIPPEQISFTHHKFDNENFGWHRYSDKQIQTALDVGLALVREYDLLDVVGHDDISQKRKWDPGPAFPMHSFRSRIMGRQDPIDTLYLTTTNTKLYEEPNSFCDRECQLDKYTKMEILDRAVGFINVKVIEGERRGAIGWVSDLDYIRDIFKTS